MNSAPPEAATYVYKRLLYLYPPSFRHEFGDEMVCDFDDLTHDAWISRQWSGVFAFWAIVSADLLRTLVVQWLRNGVPLLFAVSIAWAVSCCLLIAQQGVPRPGPLMPPENAAEEMKVLLFGFAVLVVLIAAIIVVTGWFWMQVVRRRRRA